MSRNTTARTAEACALLLKMSTLKEVQDRTGLSASSVRLVAKVLREHGTLIPERTTGRRTSADVKAKIVELVKSTDLPNSAIAREVGVTGPTVAVHRRRINSEIVAAGGEVARCGCGLDLHHGKACSYRVAKQWEARGARPIVSLSPEDQADLFRRLAAGETKRSVGDRYGLKVKTLELAVSRFTSEQKEQRRKAIDAARAARRKRIRRIKGDAPSATNPWVDSLYAEISRVVGRALEPSMRDDVIGETYLDVLEGRSSECRLLEAVKVARTRVYALHGWKQFKSLDAPDQFGRPYLEMLEAAESNADEGQAEYE